MINKKEQKGLLKGPLKGLLLAAALSAVLMAISCAILLAGKIDLKQIPVIATVISGLSVFFGALSAATQAPAGKLIRAGLVCGGYLLLLLLGNLLCVGELNRVVPVVLTALATAAAAGLLSCRSKKTNHFRRK